VLGESNKEIGYGSFGFDSASLPAISPQPYKTYRLDYVDPDDTAEKADVPLVVILCIREVYSLAGGWQDTFSWFSSSRS
jgi:hypothetical protein